MHHCFCLTSKEILGEMMKGPSVTHSSNTRLYRPSRFRILSQL